MMTCLVVVIENLTRCDEAHAMLAEIYNWFTEASTLPI